MIVNWTLRNKLQLNVSRNTKFFIYENASEDIVCKMVAILSRTRRVKILRPEQNGRHFADNSFKCIFLNKNVSVSNKMSMKNVPRCLIERKASIGSGDGLVLPGNKPSEQSVSQ